MTTTTTADSTRADAALILRAVADLIEARADIPVPGTDISFYVRGDDAPAVMAAIAAALPCRWRAEISRGSSHEWLHLHSGPYSTRGTRVSISAPAADACTAAGAKTVTVWQPAAALTGFVGTDALGEVA
ncbi:MAG: hypothetical protein JO345_02290 [Streptosporangiaceae bacterium]|nr:hypothetical protein [Streptosporangiaceae bacterium]